MAKWFYKHYKMICMIFLGVVLVGWTAFTDISDRKAATADVGRSITASSGQKGDEDGTPAPTDEALNPTDAGQITDEPSEPTQMASNDTTDPEPAITDEPVVSGGPDTPAGDGSDKTPGGDNGSETGEDSGNTPAGGS